MSRIYRASLARRHSTLGQLDTSNGVAHLSKGSGALRAQELISAPLFATADRYIAWRSALEAADKQLRQIEHDISHFSS